MVSPLSLHFQRRIWQLANAMQAAQALCLILRNWLGINALEVASLSLRKKEYVLQKSVVYQGSFVCINTDMCA